MSASPASTATSGRSPRREAGVIDGDEAGEEVFLGRSAAQPHQGISDETALQIDLEVRRIIDECYDRSTRLLEENFDKLHAMADALMMFETIDADQIDDIMAGRPAREPAGWSDTDTDDDGGSPEVDASSVDSGESGNPIGGPAGEH